MFTLGSNVNCCTAPGKTFVLYPYHYDQEMLPEEVQMFFKALKGLNFANLPLLGNSTYSYSYCPEAPNARVKYVAHRASC